MSQKPTYEELAQRVEQLSAKKQAKKKLHEHVKMLEEIFNHAADGICVCHNIPEAPYVKFTHWNPRMTGITEYTMDEINRLGWYQAMYPDPEVQKRAIERMASMRDGDDIQAEEWTITTKSGKRKPLSISTSIVKKQNEKTYILAIMLDISKRKKAEDLLRESEERFRFLTENIADIVWTLDLNLNTTYVSPSIEKILGFTPNERLQQSLEEMMTLESLQKVQMKFLEELQRDENNVFDPNRFVTMEVEYYRKDGFTVWMENRVKAIRDSADEIAGIYGVSRDITERKQAEKILRENESKFRNLFDLSPQAIALTEVKTGNLVDINNKFCELTKCSKEEIVGRTTTELGFYSDESRSTFVEKLQTSGEVDGLEMNFKAKDGSIITALMFARVIKIAGKPLVLTMFHDVTTQKQLEEKLRQSQKMEAIGTLAGGIAHEFNNILAIILGSVELAMFDITKSNPSREYLEDIQSAVLRGKDVVSQILSFARKSIVKRKSVQIGPAIKGTLKLIRASIPTTIEIRQNLSCESDTVMANSTQINQVLMNLCANARDAMKEKGGVLEVKLKNTILDERSATRYEGLIPGNYVKLIVGDTGIGIDPEIIDRIFEPYFTTTSLAEGTGMGLAVVHGIVKRHDGAIRVQSELGRGTTVEVLFPCIEMVAVEPKPEELEKLPSGNERILFVDDEKNLVRAYTNIMKSLGYDVVSFTSPTEALELFNSQLDRFDLVITDMTMPDMTGEKLSQEMIKIRSDIPIILCTGYSDLIDEGKAKETGIKGFAMKPVTAEALAVEIRKVLDDDRNRTYRNE